LNKKCKNTKNANFLETAGNFAKSSKFQSQALLLGVLQKTINGFKLYRKKCSKLNAIFKVVKMNFSSKLGAWVSFHIAILQS